MGVDDTSYLVSRDLTRIVRVRRLERDYSLGEIWLTVSVTTWASRASRRNGFSRDAGEEAAGECGVGLK